MFLRLLIIILIIFVNSCSKKEEKISIIKEKEINLQMIDAYKEGVKAFEEGDVIFAAKKFNEAEILFPQSEWAPKSALMAALKIYALEKNPTVGGNPIKDIITKLKVKANTGEILEIPEKSSIKLLLILLVIIVTVVNKAKLVKE